MQPIDHKEEFKNRKRNNFKHYQDCEIIYFAKPQNVHHSNCCRPKQLAAKLSEYWSPRIVAELDESYVKVVKLQGQLAWHSHEQKMNCSTS